MARGLLLAATAYLCWGLLSPGNEILLREVTPLWIQAIRSVLAATILALWLGPRGIRGAWAALQHPRLRAGLFYGTFVSFMLFILAQDRIPATYATLGFYTAPLWTAVFARLWIQERVGPWFLPAVAAMGFGAWATLTDAGTMPWPDPWGVTLAVGAGATWAMFSVYLRRSSADVPWKDLLLASMLMGVPLFLLVAGIFEPLPTPGAWSGETWLWTGIQVAIPTLLAMGLFQLALRHADAGQVNILVGVELAGTVLFAWLLLEARFSLLQLSGLGLVLVAVSGYLWSMQTPKAAH